MRSRKRMIGNAQKKTQRIRCLRSKQPLISIHDLLTEIQTFSNVMSSRKRKRSETEHESKKKSSLMKLPDVLVLESICSFLSMADVSSFQRTCVEWTRTHLLSRVMCRRPLNLVRSSITLEQLRKLLAKPRSQTNRVKSVRRDCPRLHIMNCPNLNVDTLPDILHVSGCEYLAFLTDDEKTQPSKEWTVQAKASHIKTLRLRLPRFGSGPIQQLCAAIPNVEEMVIGCNRDLIPSFLDALTQCSKLKKLTVGPSTFSLEWNVQNQQLAKFFRGCRDLKELTLVRIQVDNRFLVTLLEHAPSLETLRFSGLATNEGVEHLSSRSGFASSLKTVSLQDCDIYCTFLVTLLKQFPIQFLHLGKGSKFVDETDIWESIPESVSLDHLWISVAVIPHLAKLVQRLKPKTLTLESQSESDLFQIGQIGGWKLEQLRFKSQRLRPVDWMAFQSTQGTTLRSLMFHDCTDVSPVPFIPTSSTGGGFSTLKTIVVDRCGVVTDVDLIRLGWMAPALESLKIAHDHKATMDRFQLLKKKHPGVNIAQQMFLMTCRRMVEWLTGVYHMRKESTEQRIETLKAQQTTFLQQEFEKRISPTLARFFVPEPVRLGVLGECYQYKYPEAPTLVESSGLIRTQHQLEEECPSLSLFGHVAIYLLCPSFRSPVTESYLMKSLDSSLFSSGAMETVRKTLRTYLFSCPSESKQEELDRNHLDVLPPKQFITLSEQRDLEQRFSVVSESQDVLSYRSTAPTLTCFPSPISPLFFLSNSVARKFFY